MSAASTTFILLCAWANCGAVSDCAASYRMRLVSAVVIVVAKLGIVPQRGGNLVKRVKKSGRTINQGGSGGTDCTVYLCAGINA
jgi:hypothetical protein